MTTSIHKHGRPAELKPDRTILTQGSIPLKMEALFFTKKIKLTKQILEFFQELFTKQYDA